MEKEFLGKFDNICIALSINEGVITLAFTRDDLSIIVTNANSDDLLFIVKRFNINSVDVIDWFNDNNINILAILS